MPDWVVMVSWVSLASGFLCALVIVFDLIGHPQHMWIMDIVWPITALYSGPLGLWAYYRWGRHAGKGKARKHNREENSGKKRPFWQTTAVAATHCGSGCTLADIVGEWIMFFTPLVLFGRALFGTWLVDFVLAFVLGIVFQYFTIAPMRGLSLGQGMVAALKADALSLAAWQIGMYGWMAIVVFLIFGHELPKTTPVFWFMMQLAMLVGFLTSYPVNWWLLRAGIKEPM